MKHTLLVVATALMLLNSLALPKLVHADGGSGGANCNGSTYNCKP